MTTKPCAKCTTPTPEHLAQYGMATRLCYWCMHGETICTGCDDASREPAEELTRATFYFPNDDYPVMGSYCEQCCTEIIHRYGSGEIYEWTFDGPFTVAMMEDIPQ